MSKKISILVMAMPIIAIILFAIHPLYSINQDIGRHLKTGEIIWQTKSIPDTNTFSYTEPNHPFINHHWLSEVIFYGLEQIIGLKGMIIFKAIVIGLAFSLVLYASSILFGKKAAVISLTLSLPVFLNRTDLRPELFSYLFLALVIFFIAKYLKTNNHKYLIPLPIIQILWTNSHIYFPLQIGILGLVFLLNIKDKQRFKYLGFAIIASILATLINPSGISGALEPLTILNQYGYSVAENQSLATLSRLGVLQNEIVRYQYAIALILILLTVYIVRTKSFPAFSVSLLLPFMIMSAMMVRNFGPTAFIMSLALAQLLKPILIDIKISKIKTGIWSLIWLSIFISLIFGSSFAFANRKNFGLNIPNGSIEAVNFFRENNIKGPIFNNFDVGSFLIWKMYPEQKVFIDGRPEAYSVEFIQNVYIPMQEDPRLWTKYSNEYNIQSVFFDKHDATPWAGAFLYWIKQNKDWQTVFEDQRTIILIRNK